MVPKVSPVLVLTLALLGSCAAGETEAAHAHLEDALGHYDTLHTRHFKHTITPHPTLGHHRRIEFRALDRDFHLSLTPHQKIFSPKFVAHSIDGRNRKKPISLNLEEFYRGHVMGEENRTRVIANVDDRGVLTATIQTPSERYHIEPSRYFINGPHSFHMIAYRSSDVKRRLDSSKIDYVTGPAVMHESDSHSLGHTHETAEQHFSKYGHTGEGTASSHHNRLRRQNFGSLNGDSCGMILVADYLFYNFFKQQSPVDVKRSIMRRLITLISTVDELIYRPTVWISGSDSIANVGLEITEIIIHEEPSLTTFEQNSSVFYNTVHQNPTAGELLRDFDNGDWADHCLAHLFTHQNFPNGLLGLANIASPVNGETGGICSRSFSDPERRNARIIYNTGLSTFITGGRLLVLDEARLVTGHEIGHNWGSHHDASNVPECRERFLMYEFAQDASQDTHMMFSNCSRRAIGRVLLRKGTCFRELQPFCGDYRVEEGEECDVGPNADADPCCTSDCRLAVVDGVRVDCSDSNSECCENCFYAGQDRICNTARDVTFDCRTSSFCDGSSAVCPDQPFAEAGTPCVGGMCELIDGMTTNETMCRSVCELSGQVDCRCNEGGPDECKVCCMADNGLCSPFSGDLLLSNGSSCSIGVCIAGNCVQQTQDTISRVFDIFANFSIHAFGVFISENIVGFVLIFMSLLWIPTMLFVHCCVDRKIWERFVRAGGKKGVENYVDWVRRSGYEYRALRPPSPASGTEQPVESPVDTGPAPSYNHDEPSPAEMW